MGRADASKGFSVAPKYIYTEERKKWIWGNKSTILKPTLVPVPVKPVKLADDAKDAVTGKCAVADDKERVKPVN